MDCQIDNMDIHFNKCASDYELGLLSNEGFKSISVERRWSKTALMKAVK